MPQNLFSKKLDEHGWIKIAEDPQMYEWVYHVHKQACKITNCPAYKKAWLRHVNTWFAGVDVLENDAKGAFKSIALGHNVLHAISCLGYENLPLNKGQISATYPGYPQNDGSETDKAFAYRCNRFAAHIDGIIPVGAQKRRFLKEPHAYILGIPLTHTDENAAPLIVWKGSVRIMRQYFRKAFVQIPLDDWDRFDITEIYHAARRECFEKCKPIAVHTHPGGAYILHRLALHGIGLWKKGAKAPKEGRIIAYFRPFLQKMPEWLAR